MSSGSSNDCPHYCVHSYRVRQSEEHCLQTLQSESLGSVEVEARKETEVGGRYTKHLGP